MSNKQQSVQAERNQPCPCGSGIRYKQCCGSLVGAQTPSANPGGEIRPNIGSDLIAQQGVASSQAPPLNNPQQQQANMRRVNALMEDAQQAFQQGRRKVAENLCLQVLKLSAGHLGALKILIAIGRELGEAKTTEELLKRALALYPDNEELLLEHAQWLESQKKPLLAEQQVAKVVRFNPRNFIANHAMGRLAQRRGNLGQAEYYLRQAHNLRPQVPEVSNN